MNDENKKVAKDAEVTETTDVANVDELRRQCEEYLAGWKRALADYDNLKKDLAREKTAMRESAVIQTGTSLIPVIDNFDAAMRHAPDDAWAKGVVHIRTQLDDVMRQIGMEPFGVVGDAFDANLHDAVGGEGEIVKEVISRGWKIGERIVRPAKVIIK